MDKNITTQDKALLSLFPVMLFIMIIASALYAYFGHGIIEAMYYKRMPFAALNVFIRGQATHLLGYYFKESDELFRQSIAIVLINLLCAFFVRHRLILLVRETLQLPVKIKRGFAFFRAFLSRNIVFVMLTTLLFTIFYSVYYVTGTSLSKTRAFNETDILFQADVPRVIGDITDFSFNHYRTKVHPLYVLLVNPTGIFLRSLIHSQVNTAVALNAFFGSAGVALGFVFFYLFNKSLADSFILASIFGLTMSHLYTSAVPETYSLAVCSLILTYILFIYSLRNKRLSFWSLGCRGYYIAGCHIN